MLLLQDPQDIKNPVLYSRISKKMIIWHLYLAVTGLN
jgi:hypothetical protein